MPDEKWIHKRGYFLTERPYKFDKRLMKAIVSFAKKRGVADVIDMGCGDGSYVRGLVNSDISCHGVDGNPHTDKIDSCWCVDLSKPCQLFRDLVLSLEVGEHIPAKYESVFLDNITKAAEKYIILSWAVPGQGGKGHVNCRSNHYIKVQMVARGFDYKWEATNKLRRKATLSWFKNTLMVFERS